MEDTRRVNVLQPTEHLVQEELMVLRCQVIVGLDHLVQIGLHQLENNKNVLKIARRGGQHDVLDLYDVRVAQQAQQFDLAKDAGGI